MRMRSVSYTHLDVYKRQTLHSIRFVDAHLLVIERCASSCLPRVRRLSSPVKLGKMTFALAGNTGQPHRRPHDVLRGVGASQGVGIDQEAMQRLRIIMEVPELHDQFSRGRRVHARAKRGEHDRIGLFLPVRPVSYTHLDVYKRQIVTSSMNGTESKRGLHK